MYDWLIDFFIDIVIIEWIPVILTSKPTNLFIIISKFLFINCSTLLPWFFFLSQAEVLGGAILQQTFIVEYTVAYQMCTDCHRVEAKVSFLKLNLTRNIFIRLKILFLIALFASLSLILNEDIVRMYGMPWSRSVRRPNRGRLSSMWSSCSSSMEPQR